MSIVYFRVEVIRKKNRIVRSCQPASMAAVLATMQTFGRLLLMEVERGIMHWSTRTRLSTGILIRSLPVSVYVACGIYQMW